MQDMINEIYQNIAKALKNVAKEALQIDDIDVYIEDVPQGVKLPLFLIRIYEQEHTPGINYCSFNKLSVDVTYVPKSNEDMQVECLKVIESFKRCFVIDGFKSKNRHSSIADGTAHLEFEVKYKETVEDDSIKMQKLNEINTGLKGD